MVCARRRRRHDPLTAAPTPVGGAMPGEGWLDGAPASYLDFGRRDVRWDDRAGHRGGADLSLRRSRAPTARWSQLADPDRRGRPGPRTRTRRRRSSTMQPRHRGVQPATGGSTPSMLPLERARVRAAGSPDAARRRWPMDAAVPYAQLRRRAPSRSCDADASCAGRGVAGTRGARARPASTTRRFAPPTRQAGRVPLARFAGRTSRVPRPAALILRTNVTVTCPFVSFRGEAGRLRDDASRLRVAALAVLALGARVGAGAAPPPRAARRRAGARGARADQRQRGLHAADEGSGRAVAAVDQRLRRRRVRARRRATAPASRPATRACRSTTASTRSRPR